MAFKDRIERMLEAVVGDLGCSGEDLVEAIRENLNYESALSTEKRFCIQTLLTFDDHDAFYSRISEYAAEKQVVGYDSTSTGSTEISEWALQEAIARSILEAHARGQLDEAEASWLPWAEAFVQMSQAASPIEAKEIEAKAETKDNFDEDSEVQGDPRMQELEKILIRERFKVDLLVAQRIADANTQMKKQMLNLAAEIVNQDEQMEDLTLSAEEELAGLFTHIETIGERLKDVKARCFKFESISRQQMDTIYLYLKEKVHYKQDLVSQEKEIATFIFTQIHEKDESLIPLMLDVWDAPSAGYYDINSEFQLEMESVLERISREHDQERKRLELVFELEKARQKEELRKRKEKKRREKMAKKQKQKEAEFKMRLQKRKEKLLSLCQLQYKANLSIRVPGHGQIDLAHLLSDAHATRHRQLKGITPAQERAMLNPATLRYLTEQLAIKQPDVLKQQVRREIVLEEAAEEK
eukprot:jgi/Phyca11/10849/fgenesh1_pm.PHYCAscaffold_55_\